MRHCLTVSAVKWHPGAMVSYGWTQTSRNAAVTSVPSSSLQNIISTARTTAAVYIHKQTETAMISLSSLNQLYRNVVSLLTDGMSGQLAKGMRNRIILATILTIVSIIADVWLCYSSYDYLPMHVSGGYDWQGVPHFSENKSIFWLYDAERIVLTVLMSGCGWLIWRKNKNSIIRLRHWTFLVELANLIVMTAVGISIAMMLLALGQYEDTFSEWWEWLIMGGWFFLLVLEYAVDLVKLSKLEKKKEQ